ncbi:MAG: hypothetical protein Q4C12_00095 [Clostridia bacterium]|nr:hypothetical protein [Clostridia bacterium]
MALNEDLLNKRIKELDSLYEQALKQITGLQNTIVNLKKYAGYIVKSGDFTSVPSRMSNEAWRKRASEMIRELIKLDKKNYPTFNSVLYPIYIRLRDVYGVVLDQLRKDFRYDNYTLRYPSAFEAISSDDVVREIFDSLLISLFPKDYFEDEVLSAIERGDAVECIIEQPEEIMMKIIAPLAIKNNDDSYGYINTFESVCDNMDCSWGNLQTRYI